MLCMFDLICTLYCLVGQPMNVHKLCCSHTARSYTHLVDTSSCSQNILSCSQVLFLCAQDLKIFGDFRTPEVSGL